MNYLFKLKETQFMHTLMLVCQLHTAAELAATMAVQQRALSFMLGSLYTAPPSQSQAQVESRLLSPCRRRKAKHRLSLDSYPPRRRKSKHRLSLNSYTQFRLGAMHYFSTERMCLQEIEFSCLHTRSTYALVFTERILVSTKDLLTAT